MLWIRYWLDTFQATKYRMCVSANILEIFVLLLLVLCFLSIFASFGLPDVVHWSRKAKKTKMIKHFFKNWLVPHHGNRHQPHLLRLPSLSIISLFLVIIQLAYNFSVTGQWRVLAYSSDISQNQIIELTNKERLKFGQSALKESSALDQAARMKAEDMFANDYWNHISPKGTEPWHFFKKAGYTYTYAGENLARSFDTSSGVIAGWMGSPGHKTNLLSPNYTEIGIAVVNGVLQGEETTLVVAHYGAPVESAVTLNTKPSPEVVVKPTEPEDVPVTVNGEQQLSGDPENDNELAPTPRDYSMVRPLFFTGTMGWGQLLTLATTGALVPIYAATHIKMLKRKLHIATRWMWRRRLLELIALVGIISRLLMGGWGSVG